MATVWRWFSAAAHCAERMLRLRSADCNADQLPHNSLLHERILGDIICLLALLEQPAVGLSNARFSSTQRRVLSLPFGNPDRSYLANEIQRLGESGIGSVHLKPRKSGQGKATQG